MDGASVLVDDDDVVDDDDDIEEVDTRVTVPEEGQHCTSLVPARQPACVATLHVNAVVSMHWPEHDFSAALLVAVAVGAGGVGAAVDTVALTVLTPLSQHLMWLAPRQKPVLTAAPTQECVLVFMHVPGWFPKHGSVLRGVGVAVADATVVAFSSFLPLSQHLMWVAPRQNPTLTEASTHVCVLVSMHIPGWPLVHASLLADVDTRVVVVAILGAFWLVGQQTMLKPPRQKPFFTSSPTHTCVSVSMHVPGWLFRHASLGAVTVEASVVAGFVVVVLGDLLPLGQHLHVKPQQRHHDTSRYYVEQLASPKHIIFPGYPPKVK